MKLLNDIQAKITTLKLGLQLDAICIVMHPETERNVFLKGELQKSESLEDRFALPIILDKSVPVNEFIIGV